MMIATQRPVIISIRRSMVGATELPHFFRNLIPPTGLIPGEALNYAVQIAAALAALHAKGIVHRDLKPTNVMVGEGTVVRVLDFGLCKLTERIAGEEDCTPSTMEQTVDGVAVATPAYMSPEQVEGKSVDTRSDIFSFGILLYEMLTGRRPFQGGTRLGGTVRIRNRASKRRTGEETRKTSFLPPMLCISRV